MSTKFKYSLFFIVITILINLISQNENDGHKKTLFKVLYFSFF